jgi:hypothetical protein
MTAPVVAAALGAVAEKQSSRERTDAGERTYDNAAGPRNSPKARLARGRARSTICICILAVRSSSGRAQGTLGSGL